MHYTVKWRELIIKDSDDESADSGWSGVWDWPLNEFVVVLLFSLFIALVLDMSIIVFSTL